MKLDIRLIQNKESSLWDNYVNRHPHASVYHLSGWKQVLQQAYHKQSFYIAAFEKTNCVDDGKSMVKNPRQSTVAQNEKIVGILPLVLLKDPVFENALISMPFFDYGGVLADEEQIAFKLISKGIEIGKMAAISHLELRQTQQGSRFLLAKDNLQPLGHFHPGNVLTRTHKVRMLLRLPGSSEEMMAAFKSKLRSQINKPLKEGLLATVGGKELLNDFFNVFSVNMRDLGSPVHSKRLFSLIFEQFPEIARIASVFKGNHALACGVMLCYKDRIYNPWSASLREFSRLSPNMLLYWNKMAYGCDNGFRFLDLGRSTPGEGTYRFKKQWGTEQDTLYWHYIGIDKKPQTKPASENVLLNRFANLWKSLPLGITRLYGPFIRRYIGL